MNVLVVNQYFPPDRAATAGVFADLAEVLTQRGHRVRVVCGRPSYDPVDERPSLPPAVTVEHVWSTSFDRKLFLGRLLNYLSFLTTCRFNSLSGSDRPDAVVVGTDPPLAVWAALHLASGAPVIYSVQDLHPEAALAARWLRRGLRSKWWDALHRRALSRVDAVVAIGHDMAERLQQKGVAKDRLSVVPNGAPQPRGRPQGSVVEAIRRGRGFVVVHAGNLGTTGAWETLLEAGRDLEGVVDLVFVGDGVAAARIHEAAREIHGLFPPSQISSVMAAGDLQIVTMKAGMEGISLPSKLYTILAHGRPVLAVVPSSSEVARVVNEFKCGYVVDPQDVSGLVSTLRHAASSPNELREMARAAKEASTRFDRRQCMAQLASVVEEVAATFDTT
jgi:colanic acid biosynthesis glycosyl transferase WcaI